MSRFPCRCDEEGRLVPLHPERTKALRPGRDGLLWMEAHELPTIGIRSNPANSYLWAVVYRRIAEETGNDPESVHYGLKRMAVEVGVLPPEYTVAGSTLLEAEPTTKQDSEVFWRYVGWIREGAETGSLFGQGTRFHIPEPNEWEDVS